ncbi:Amidase 1 [Hypsizygus marmoreus]|uniref:Amidase 1 n=1 Tax=Hypsizygus marmoreus TaxID=39966 RepID=A0A369JKA0_HYPMA|nr:Amidase 1 [Hypsizygus marmoreus]
MTRTHTPTTTGNMLSTIWRSISVLFVASSVLVSASVDVVQTERSGIILQLHDTTFYTTNIPFQTVYPSHRSGITPGFTAVTSIHAQYSPITKAFLESQITLYSNIDDVWNDKFLDALFISYDGQMTGFFDEEAERWLESIHLSHLYVSTSIRHPSLKTPKVSQVSVGPPAGPFFATASSKSAGLDLHHVYRLHRDEYESFLFGAVPDANGGWKLTNITMDESGIQYIPIPSRISLLAKALPLSGTRFALKDIFDAQGLPTGAASLAYARTYPSPNLTAPAIQRLTDLGATMVGKTRTSQFAHGASPWEFHDIPYSWNPRADGYLTASASSSGSACAIAGYDWVDFTVGSDTRGSVRKPAALVGAYGIRPSHGSMDLTGVVPLSEEMDTAGFFARDPRLFSEIGHFWYENSPVRIKRPTIRFPTKLLYPTDHFPVKNPTAQALYDSFADALNTHLKIKKVDLNFTDALLPYLPNGNFTKFQQYSNTLAEYRSWVSVGKPLIDRHREVFGTDPKFDPKPREMFARAAHLTEDDFTRAVAFRRQFRQSIAENLIKADRKSCSDAIFMYDAGTGGHPSYRVEDFNALAGATQLLLTSPTANAKPSEFFTYISSMAGLPEITVPIGQVGYYSQVSRQWEKLPVTVQLVAHPGCDDMLFELVKKLAGAGVLSATKVGRDTF